MSEDSDRLLAEIDRAFVSAIDQIHERVQGNIRKAELELETKFGERLYGREFFRLRFRDRKKRTTLKDKLALIAAHRIPSEDSIAEWIFRRIVADDQSRTLTKKYDGSYRYWRHFPNESADDKLRWGVVRLETVDNKYTQFSHWSHDEIVHRKLQDRGVPASLEKFDKPEDTGFAFFSRSRLFAVGFRTGNIRLTIADLPAENRSEAIYTGIVITTRKHGANIFSAGFIMVHEENALFRRALTQEDFKREIGLSVDRERFLLHT